MEKEKTGRNGDPGVVGEEGGRRPTGSPTTPAGRPPVPTRWTAPRKAQVVTRILRGEPMDALSRELGVPIYRLEEWHQKALRGVETALKSRKGDAVQDDLDAALKRVGELSMEVELLETKVERLEARHSPLPRRRSRR